MLDEKSVQDEKKENNGGLSLSAEDKHTVKDVGLNLKQNLKSKMLD